MVPQRCSTPPLKLCEPVTYDSDVLMYWLCSGCQPVIQKPPPQVPVDRSYVDELFAFQSCCSRRHLLYCTEKPASISSRFDSEDVHRDCAW